MSSITKNIETYHDVVDRFLDMSHKDISNLTLKELEKHEKSFISVSAMLGLFKEAPSMEFLKRVTSRRREEIADKKEEMIIE